jgi:hypothetical protein
MANYNVCHVKSFKYGEEAQFQLMYYDFQVANYCRRYYERTSYELLSEITDEFCLFQNFRPQWGIGEINGPDC